VGGEGDARDGGGSGGEHTSAVRAGEGGRRGRRWAAEVIREMEGGVGASIPPIGVDWRTSVPWRRMLCLAAAVDHCPDSPAAQRSATKYLHLGAPPPPIPTSGTRQGPVSVHATHSRRNALPQHELIRIHLVSNSSSEHTNRTPRVTRWRAK
jgi:hypothetical protein